LRTGRHFAVKAVADTSRAEGATTVIVVTPTVYIAARATGTVEVGNTIEVNGSIGVSAVRGGAYMEIKRESYQQVKVVVPIRILVSIRYMFPGYPSAPERGRPSSSHYRVKFFKNVREVKERHEVQYLFAILPFPNQRAVL
jgi:hypothetical protein